MSELRTKSGTNWTRYLRSSLSTGVVTPPTGVSTRGVYPTLTTHPNAAWVETGGWLTSPDRRNLPVDYQPDGATLATTKRTWANTAQTTAGKTTFVGNTTNKYELVTTADGQVISDMYLPTSRIRICHRNVTIKRCLINTGYYSGRTNIQANCGVVTDPAFNTAGWRLEDVTVDPINAGGTTPSSNLRGYYYDQASGTWTFSTVPNTTDDDSSVCGFFLIGEGFATRCATRRVTDGFMPDRINNNTAEGSVHVWGNYIETRWLSYDPEQSDSTHNDGIQLSHGGGDTIIGNTIVCPPGGVIDPVTGKDTKGQCVVLTPYHGTRVPTKDAAQIDSTVIIKNWFSGSYTQIGSWLPLDEGGPGAPNLVIEGNRHGGACVWPILLTPTTNSTKRSITGNVADAGDLKWDQPQRTTTAGTTISPTVAATGTPGAGDSVSVATAYAGNDQIVEGGQTCYLEGKGKTSGNAWIKTGTWARTAGAAVTVTNSTSSDGHTYASFVAPTSTTTQTVTLTFTPAGQTVTDSVIVTIPGKQT